MPNKGATNETGFTALPGGTRTMNGEFRGLGEGGLWWTSSEENDYVGFGWTITSYDNRVGPLVPSKRYGNSVRCVKDYSIEELNALKSQRDSILDTSTAADFSGIWQLEHSQLFKGQTSSKLLLNNKAIILL